MNRDQLIALHCELTKMAREVLKKKNQDYADDFSVFGNLDVIETLFRGERTTEEGILVRMGDKLSRLATACKRTLAVNDESVDDTVIDIINYAILFAAKRRSRAKLPVAMTGHPTLEEVDKNPHFIQHPVSRSH